MKLSYVGLLSLLINACASPGNEELLTLKRIYMKRAPKMIRSVEKLKHEVQDLGSRTKDLELLSQVELLVQTRQQAGIYFNRKDLDTSAISVDKASIFIDSLENYSTRLEILSKVRGPLAWGKSFLHKHEQNHNYLDYLNCLVNLQAVEHKILEQFLRQVAVCENFFSLNFYLNSNADTILNGTEYEMIISLKPQIFLESWEISIDSLTLHRGDELVEEQYEFSKIGTAGYFSFHPKQPGEYKFSGNYKLHYPLEGYEFKETFVKTFLVEK